MADGIRFSPVSIYAEGHVPEPVAPSGIFLFRIQMQASGGVSGIRLRPPTVAMHAIQGVADTSPEDTLPTHIPPVLSDEGAKIAS